MNTWQQANILSKQNYGLANELVVFERRGQLFLTTLLGNMRPNVITTEDLILLFFLQTSNDLIKAAQGFLQSGYVKAKLGDINTKIITDRLQGYINSGLIKTKPAKTTTNHVKPDQLKYEYQTKRLKDSFAFALSRDFALKPSHTGFITGESISLTIQELIIISVLPRLKNIAQLCEFLQDIYQRHEIEKTIINLVENKIIRIVNSLKECHETFSEIDEKQKKIKRLIEWEQIIADRRIPVYFVPHMQNHFPLALGVLQSSLRNFNEGALNDYFNFLPITYCEPQELLNRIYRKFGAGIWLFSNYMWSLELNLQISAAVKNHNTDNITIHGGPSTPDYKEKTREFMLENTSVDVCVHGEGEAVVQQVFKQFARALQQNQPIGNVSLSGVKGTSYKLKGSQTAIVQNESQDRIADLDTIESPYLNGIFENYGVPVEAAIIESNRGCPFGCTFCDWGSATKQKVRKFSLNRVKKEIRWIAENKVKVLWIADANFGIHDRDIELAEYIIEVKKELDYPQEVVVNYTKNSTWRLAKIIEIFTNGGIVSQGIISIQTTDEQTLNVINRKNIKTEKFDELLGVFQDLKLPLSTDLMMGLPGITTEGFYKDLQRYLDLDVSVKAYPTQMLPNSPMADPEYIEKYKIKVDENNFLISSYSYSVEDLQRMKKIFKTFTVVDGYSLMRYVIRFIQWDYGISALEQINCYEDAVNTNPHKYPHVYFAFNFFETEKCMPMGWNHFYRELELLILDVFKIEKDSALSTVLLLNNMVMPRDTVSYPITLDLEHDVCAYFEDHKMHREKRRELYNYAPSQVLVSDPNNLSKAGSMTEQYDSHQYFWELHLPVSRNVSQSVFMDSNKQDK
ncbi:MAG: B12-binding domain-containing radical SAM protein [bacterium]